MPEQIFNAGSIVREFKVTCSVCRQFHRAESTSIDQFAKEIGDQWRLSRDLGWVHRSCLKMVPEVKLQ